MIEETVNSWQELVIAVQRIETQLFRNFESTYPALKPKVHSPMAQAMQDCQSADGESTDGQSTLNRNTRNERRFWYRGHAKSVYTLSPSLYRYSNGKAQEESLYKRFSQIEIANPAPRQNSWERLVSMQQYQVPTRLLDWTEVLGVAAYFAAAPTSHESPCIYILDALWLNVLSAATHVQELPADLPMDYETHYLGPKLSPQFEHPFAARTGFHNDRILRQRGCFTIHGNNDRPLEIQFPDCLGRVTLSTQGRDDVFAHLTRMNVNAFTLFPDFEGLAQFVATDVGLDMPAYDQSIARLIESSLREYHNRAKRILSDPSSTAVPLEPPIYTGLRMTHYVRRSPEADQLKRWLEPTDNHTFVIIEGPAGIGKTSFLLESLVFHASRPVVFFPHKNLKDPSYKGVRRFEDVLADYVDTIVRNQFPERARNAIRRETIHHVTKEMIRSGALVVVLDGLDEVARTSDLDSARNLVQDLVDFLGPQSRSKVAISCRDHILRRIDIGQMLAPKIRHDFKPKRGEVYKIIRLKALDKDEVLTSILTYLQGDKPTKEATAKARARVTHIPDALMQFLCIPIFLRLVTGEATIGHSGTDVFERVRKLEKKVELYEEWFNVVLENAAPPHDREKFITTAMEELGKRAVETLEGRVEYFDPRQLPSELGRLFDYDGTSSLRILAKETDSRCSFAHQSLREFILARAVANEIRGTSAFEPLKATPSFDYVGAETYEFVNELLHFPADVLEQLPALLDASKGSDTSRWNCRARNLFEMIGMLAKPTQLTASVLDAIRKLAQELLTKRKYAKRIYVDYSVKQNVVRCLERLHPSAPMPYFTSVLNREHFMQDKEYRTIEAYAIRGFQLKAPRPSRYPRMLFKNEIDVYPGFKDMEEFVVDLLLKSAGALVDQSTESGVHFFRINASFALIRWLPVQIAWRRLEKAFPLTDGDRYVATNVYHCLNERQALNKVSRDYRELVEKYRRKSEYEQ